MKDFGRWSHSRMRVPLVKLWLPLLFATLLIVATPQIVSAAVTSSVVGGVLTVSNDADAADPITIICDATFVKINGLDPGTGAAACNTIATINVSGGPGDNTIDLTTVAAADFPVLTSITLNGGAGNDTITGSGLADTLNGDADNDTLIGAKGDDSMNGGPGSDTLIWNNGDNSDTMNGDDDDDTVVVNGAPAGDIFEIAPNGARVAFTRTNLIPFTLDIDAEALVVNGGDGDDIVTATVGLKDLITLTLNGGNGNDQFTGGDGVDILNGDADDDTLIGAKGDDSMNGGPGSDTLVWNNGDNSDTMNGDDDTVVENGAPAQVFEAAGLNAASIQSAVDQFRNNLGDNNGVGESVLPGRREVNWDGVPADSLDPFAGDFFVVRSPRGIEFSTPGSRLKVSGDPDTPSFEFADVTAIEPDSGDPAGPIEFASFSPFKLFAPMDSIVTDIHFYVPGTDTPATVTAFGAVFVDVDLANTTRMLFYDVGGSLIYSREILVSGVESEGLSFVGVVLPEGKRAARVQLITGSEPVDSIWISPPPDWVAIDDVIFAEPTIWYTDTVVVNGAPAGDTFEIAPNGARVAFSRTNLIPFTLDINADALVVNGGDGEDIVTATAGLKHLISLTLNGGNGNDQLTGGDGQDKLIGGPGDDNMNGGPGNDTLIWNNGDNSDVMNGEADADTVVVNGAPVGDIFEIAPNGARVAFTRTNLVPFTLDIDVEALEVNGGDGDDIFNVLPLPATTIKINGGAEVTASASGVNDADAGDELTVDARNRVVVESADTIQVEGTSVIRYTGIENVEILNRNFPIYLPITMKSD